MSRNHPTLIILSALGYLLLFWNLKKNAFVIDCKVDNNLLITSDSSNTSPNCKSDTDGWMAKYEKF